MDRTNMPKDPFCQSCGMPLETLDQFGTDASGNRTGDYCIYCYHNGEFTEPQVSCDEMIERVADHLVKKERMVHVQARDIAEGIVPCLKRWAHAHAS